MKGKNGIPVGGVKGGITDDGVVVPSSGGASLGGVSVVIVVVLPVPGEVEGGIVMIIIGRVVVVSSIFCVDKVSVVELDGLGSHGPEPSMVAYNDS